AFRLRQRRVAKAAVFGDLVSEPVRRSKAYRLLLGRELDLGDHQAIELAAVDVHVGDRPVQLHTVAGLLQGGDDEGPELVELLDRQGKADLDAAETAERLHRELAGIVLGAHADLHGLDGEITLPDRRARHRPALRKGLDLELPLDLGHASYHLMAASSSPLTTRAS